ncbi:myrosinase 1-like [Colias croceus]|uniref:myrosinase 1-like n=1 Tax=Colias crocea TaxID=72248 RepID=UPI001E27E9C8|nr:myrosinase 1-like [Colias croceus]
MLRVLIFIFIVNNINGQPDHHYECDVRAFPEGFLFGTATSSYQTEGAWNKSGKTENIWDHLTHTQPYEILDHSNGDVADDSYHLYKRDIEMMRELGVHFHRFSISWTRILPTSFPDEINQDGVDYYNNLINEMLKYGIEPMVTLYHWELPQKLQLMGGWTNPNIINWFADFARVAFELFGDRVKYWVTINEPYQICNEGYGDRNMAPMLNVKGVAEYICTKNLLLAHATAYHMYDREYRSKYKGVVFITCSASWYEPESQDHYGAAWESNQFTWAQHLHPIFSHTGDYPRIMKEKIAAKSKEQGFFRSRLIEFTPEEIKFVKGSSDALGLNHYSTTLVYKNESVKHMYESPSFMDDLGVGMASVNDRQGGGMVDDVPWGFYNLLTTIREEYGNPPIYITENGFSTKAGLVDDDRVTYYRGYLSAMLDAIEEGSDIQAYTAWSLMDNFEWKMGYTERFGLYEVDYNSSDRTRTARKSAYVYKEIVRTGTLDMCYAPDLFMPISIDEGH